MFDNIENTSSVCKDTSSLSERTQVELDYIRECVCPPKPEELAARIDDIQGGAPPKALDSDPKIAAIIEPLKDILPKEYFEAPSDIEQVDTIVELLSNTEGIKLQDWQKLSLDQRVDLLNRLEKQIAEIEHRPACPIRTKDLGNISEQNGGLTGLMGEHITTAFGQEYIYLNSELVKSNNPVFYDMVLETLLHEGRHSYQTYNLEQRETHTSPGDITNWRINLDHYGYQNPQLCGFKSYWLQPIEADARKFAEDVLTAYKQRI